MLEKRKYIGSSKILTNVKAHYRRYGLRGFYNGLTISLIRTVPTGGMSFLAYELAKEYLEELRKE